MNAYSLAMFWAMIQITLGCMLSLSVVWCLRGRRPQVASALLSGSCVMSLLLLINAAFPQHQWSLADAMRYCQSWPTRGEFSELDSTHGRLVGSPLFADAEDGSAGSFVSLPRTQRNLPGVALPRGSWEWLSVQLFAVDEHLRQVSQSHAAQQRLATLSGALTLIVMLGVFCAWLVGWCHARRIARHCTPIETGLIRGVYQPLLKQIGGRLEPRIYVSSHIAAGATMGWRRPVIILNRSYREWQPEQLAAVLAHELAHTVRRDYAWVIVSSLARVILWFHPLMHVVVRRLRFEQELAADQIAASSLGANAYGRALAQLTFANQIPLRTPSPMLAAGQICVIRRISMLKQGRLKPQLVQPRWAVNLALLAIATAVPLSGLRGQTGVAPNEEAQSTVEVSSVSANAKPDGPSREEELAALAKFPPFLADGTMVYRQGRMNHSKADSPSAWWANFLQAAAMGSRLPDDCVLFGHAGLKLQWRDLIKERGSLTTTGTIRAAENSLPGDLSKLLSAPFLSICVPLDETRILAGRTARAYTVRGSKDQQPLCWVIDDEQGYHYAETIEGLEADLSRTNMRPQVSAIYQADFQAAAAAVLFSDCTQLLGQFQEFMQGSKKPELALVPQVLGGLKSLGIFFMPGGELTVRANFANEESAARVRLLLAGLIATVVPGGNDNADPDQQILSMISDLEITQDGTELAFLTDGNIYARIAAIEMLAEQSSDIGWLTVGSIHAAEDGAGLVLAKDAIGRLPNVIQQSVNAVDYQGRRVALTAEISYREGFESYGGIAAWANDATDMPVAFASLAGDGISDLQSLVGAGQVNFPNRAGSASTEWKRVTIELDVPNGAADLSFGVYCKHASVRIRELALSDVGPARAQSQECPSFLRAFNIPGRPILNRPTNLSFEIPADSQVESRVAESKPIAERK